MSLSPRNYLCHIRDEARFLIGVVEKYSQEEFITEPTVKRACVRALLDPPSPLLSRNLLQAHFFL